MLYYIKKKRVSLSTWLFNFPKQKKGRKVSFPVCFVSFRFKEFNLNLKYIKSNYIQNVYNMKCKDKEWKKAFSRLENNVQFLWIIWRWCRYKMYFMGEMKKVC